ncbi:MAG: L-rhamnose isomerase [Bacteroidales bacterium]
MTNSIQIQKSYAIAKDLYAAIGIDTEMVIEKLKKASISIHCWQGDDVGGFERPNATLGAGGTMVTGNFKGKARNVSELKMDIEKVLSLVPGKNRLNLHAIYGEFDGKLIDRDQIEPAHFQGWVEWAKKLDIALDFNCSLFSHPKVDSGFTISDKNPAIREFWIEHINRCRTISEYFGKELGKSCVHNIWIPDGSKDITVDRLKHRELLTDSLDKIFAQKIDKKYMRDALESKLFGIGSESYVVGSHEFYMGYGIKNNHMICLDMGHFHQTESVADKISSMLLNLPEIMLHVSRGVRWDSDHVVILNDDLRFLFEEITRANALDRVNIGLDFFDASINRVGAWAIGTRAAQKALLLALLEPIQLLRQYEDNVQYAERLALLEEVKSMPWGAVWDYYCLQNNVPVGQAFIAEIQAYEKNVLNFR